jgi:hypothetical protein
VVHGVHILLRALDGFWAQAGAPRALSVVQAVFLRPLRLGRVARVETRGQKADGARLVVVGDEGEDLVRITVRWAAGAPTGTGDFGVPAHRAAPAEPAGFANLAGTVGVGCDPVLLARLLPHLAAALPARYLALILATTYLVGMEAPGRHSLFTQLDLTFDPQPGHGDLAWQARRFDERFSLLTLGLEAGDARGECVHWCARRPWYRRGWRRLPPMSGPAPLPDSGRWWWAVRAGWAKWRPSCWRRAVRKSA